MEPIVVIGAGGVGAETLLRLKKSRVNARIRIIDRDFIENDSLKRQTLYRKADVGHLKAEVAAKKLGKNFVGISEHLSESNPEELLQDAAIVLDCTDNWATRCVINQWALEHRKPWIFTSAIRTESMASTLTPTTACFVCWNPNAATPRSCRVEGITKETTAVAAETQVMELLQLLEDKARLEGKLQYTDTQEKACTTIPLIKNPDCLACVKKTFRLPKAQAITLCGDGEYLFQLEGPLDAKRLDSLKPKKFGDVMKISWKKGEMIVFHNGRTLTRGMNGKEAGEAFAMLEQKTKN